MRLTLAVVLGLVIGCSPAGVGTRGPDGTVGPDTTAAWRTKTLTDVVSGAEFTIDGLQGNLVVVETMAIWCTTCRIQQREAQAAIQQLDQPEVVYISLDVDPNERGTELAQYARDQGFDWRFAVAPPAVSRSLAEQFGEQVLSPPSTPLVILDQHGALIETHFGIKASGDLAALLAEHLQ